ncbi:Uncharacterised protein [Mycobacteroides abscessus subsp. massiliense]|nr:Uncharacterised protein [Mycobacteroides abscessus subsp. massiliense]
MAAHRDLLPGHAHHAVGGHRPRHPIAATALVSGGRCRDRWAHRSTGSESLRWGGHLQRLMRPNSVVGMHPCVQCLLRHLQVRERLNLRKEFSAQTAVKPLDLARRRRGAWRGQQVLDPLLTADRIEEHLHRRMVEPPGEHPAVISQNLLRHTISGDCIDQPVTDRPSAFSGHQPGTHAHPGMIINSRERLSAGAVGQREPAHHIHLP